MQIYGICILAQTIENFTMKKITILLFLLCVLRVFASEPVFDKQYYECENKWVVLPKKAEDKSYSVGVVYLDRVAGFTFMSLGNVIVDGNGKYLFTPFDITGIIIHRLPERCVALALIPADKIADMKLDTRMEWLDIYRNGENDVDQIVKRGWHFNHVGGSEQAIPILIEGYKKQPHYDGLEFELAYAYNATGKFSEAEKVLMTALKNDPKNYMFMRELGYAYINMEKIADAEKIYNKGISLSDSEHEQSEMAFNMTGVYFTKGDEGNFKKWLKIAKKYTKPGSAYEKPLAELEAKFVKK